MTESVVLFFHCSEESVILCYVFAALDNEESCVVFSLLWKTRILLLRFHYSRKLLYCVFTALRKSVMSCSRCSCRWGFLYCYFAAPRKEDCFRCLGDEHCCAALRKEGCYVVFLLFLVVRTFAPLFCCSAEREMFCRVFDVSVTKTVVQLFRSSEESGLLCFAFAVLRKRCSCVEFSPLLGTENLVPCFAVVGECAQLSLLKEKWPLSRLFVALRKVDTFIVFSVLWIREILFSCSRIFKILADRDCCAVFCYFQERRLYFRCSGERRFLRSFFALQEYKKSCSVFSLPLWTGTIMPCIHCSRKRGVLFRIFAAES